MPGNQTKSSSTSRRVWQLAWPTIISNLLFSTVGFLHIKIASSLGTSAVAAVTTGHRVFFLVQAVLMGLSVATTAAVARNWGADNIHRAEVVTWTSMALAIIVAILLSIGPLFFPELIAGAFGLDQETTLKAARFIFWLGLFNVFSALSMILSTALRATGDVITPLWFLFFSSLSNVVCAYLLTNGSLGIPAMGVPGIALGGSAAAAVVTVLFVAVWWRDKFNLKPLKQAQINVPAARQLISIGLPSILEQGFVQLAFLVFFAIVARYGTTAYAAYGIGISLVSFSIVVGFAFGIAGATLVGQHLGAGQPDMAMKAGWRSLRMALVAMIVFSIVMALYAYELAAFMIDDEETIHLTATFIYVIAFCQPLMAVDFALSGALRGAGDTRYPLLATIAGILLGRMLPSILFLSLGLSIYWILMVMIADYGIKAVLILVRYRSGKWMHLKLA